MKNVKVQGRSELLICMLSPLVCNVIVILAHSLHTKVCNMQASRTYCQPDHIMAPVVLTMEICVHGVGGPTRIELFKA